MSPLAKIGPVMVQAAKAAKVPVCVHLDHCETLDYMQQAVYLPDEENAAFVEFGTPNLPMRTHNEMFNWLDNYPAPPVPYQSYNEDNSYAPEGHPDYVEEEGK